MDSSNLVMIVVALVIAVVAIYILYAIILYQGSTSKGEDLQLTTKNVLDQVEVLYSKQEYALVELLATKYLDRVPGHNHVRLYLAKAFYEDKKYNQALKHCEIILKKNPNNVETHEVMGKCYIEKGWLNKAIQEFEFVYERRKTDKKTVKTLAELYTETEQLYMAISAYNALSELLEVDEEIADVQGILAELNKAVHDFPAAFEAYKRRLTILPTDVETNKRLAELYIKINNYPVALETLMTMLTFVEDNKTLLWIYENIIDIHVATEEYEKAISCSEKLMEIPGADKFKIRDNIAQYNLKLGNVKESVLILEDLTLLSQNAFDITIKLADAYITDKEYQKALDKYMVLMDKATQREVKPLNQHICNLYITWAKDYSEQGKYEESDDMLKKATQYNPINPEIYYCFAQNCMNTRNHTGAVEQINHAIEYDKDKTNLTRHLLLLADAHHHLGNFFEEKKALSDLLKHDEKNAEGLYKMGIMYSSQNDTKSAEESYRAALESNPDMIQAKFSLAQIYEINNRDRARELYMEILEVEPGNEEVKRALSEMSITDYF